MKNPLLHGICALFLTVSLALPGSAYALRSSIENDTPQKVAAGMEEKEINPELRQEIDTLFVRAPGKDVTLELLRDEPGLIDIWRWANQSLDPAVQNTLDYLGENSFFFLPPKSHWMNQPASAGFHVRNFWAPVHHQYWNSRQPTRSSSILAGPSVISMKGTGSGKRERYPIQLKSAESATDYFSHSFWNAEDLSSAEANLKHSLRLQRVAREAGFDKPLTLITPAQVIRVEGIPSGSKSKILPVIAYFNMLADKQTGTRQVMRSLLYTFFGEQDVPPKEMAERLFSRRPLAQTRAVMPTEIRSVNLPDLRVHPETLDTLYRNLYAAYGHDYIPPAGGGGPSHQVYAAESYRLNQIAADQILLEAARSLGQIIGVAEGIGVDVSETLQATNVVGFSYANDFDSTEVPGPNQAEFDSEHVDSGFTSSYVNANLRLMDLSFFLSGEHRLKSSAVARLFEAMNDAFVRVQETVIGHPEKGILHPHYIEQFIRWRGGDGRRDTLSRYFKSYRPAAGAEEGYDRMMKEVSKKHPEIVSLGGGRFEIKDKRVEIEAGEATLVVRVKGANQPVLEIGPWSAGSKETLRPTLTVRWTDAGGVLQERRTQKTDPGGRFVKTLIYLVSGRSLSVVLSGNPEELADFPPLGVGIQHLQEEPLLFSLITEQVFERSRRQFRNFFQTRTLESLREIVSATGDSFEKGEWLELGEMLEVAREALQDLDQETRRREEVEITELELKVDWMEASWLTDTLFDGGKFEEDKAYRALELHQRISAAPEVPLGIRESSWIGQAAVLAALVGKGLLKEGVAMERIIRPGLSRKTVFGHLQMMFSQRMDELDPDSPEFMLAMSRFLAYGLAGLLLPAESDNERAIHSFQERMFLSNSEQIGRALATLREILPFVRFRSADNGKSLTEDLLKPDWRAVYEVAAVAAGVLADVTDRAGNPEVSGTYKRLQQAYLEKLSGHPGYSSYVRGRIIYQKAGAEEVFLQGLTPIVIGTGMEEQYPPLKGLEKIPGLSVVFVRGRPIPEVVADLVGRDARRVVFAGAEEEAARFASIAEMAGISTRQVRRDRPDFVGLLLAIVSEAAGAEESSVAARREFSDLADRVTVYSNQL